MPENICAFLHKSNLVGVWNQTPYVAKCFENCDLIEIRLDTLQSLHSDPSAYPQVTFQHPLILTPRTQEEGGSVKASLEERMRWVDEAPYSPALIDWEWSTFRPIRSWLQEKQSQNVSWVASFHDFNACPSEATLERVLLESREAGADLVKMAVRVDQLEDLARLLQFFAKHSSEGPLSMMGMGRFGQVSRLALAQAGSVLNYAYVGESNAPGQWHIDQFRSLLQQLS